MGGQARGPSVGIGPEPGQAGHGRLGRACRPGARAPGAPTRGEGGSRRSAVECRGWGDVGLGEVWADQARVAFYFRRHALVRCGIESEGNVGEEIFVV